MNYRMLKLSCILLKFSQEYYKYKDKIEELSKKNPYPFKSWFDENGRTYIDFKKVKLEPDKEVRDFLLYNDYIITDYGKGLAKDLSGRVMKIGKILNKIEKGLIERLKTDYDISKSEEDLEKYKNDIKDKVNYIRKIFEESPARKGEKHNLKVVFSQNPHDVAKMSTDRSWGSCMTLGSGKYHENIYCEVSNGGFVAYLIKNDDLNIEHPISRIHIRRFEDIEGNSIAIPEEAMYGESIPAFYNLVKEWVNKHNNIKSTMYELKGGKYSDTFKDTEIVLHDENEKKLYNWLLGKDLPKDIIKKEWFVIDAYKKFISKLLGKSINYDKSFETKDEAIKYIYKLKQSNQIKKEIELILTSFNEITKEKYLELLEDRFYIVEKDTTDIKNFKLSILDKISRKELKLSNEFVEKIVPILFKEGTHMEIADFALAYPDLITKENILNLDIDDLRLVLTALPTDLMEIGLAKLQQKLLDTVDEAISNNDIDKLISTNVLFILGSYLDDKNANIVANKLTDFLINKKNEMMKIYNKDNKEPTKKEYRKIKSVFIKLMQLASYKEVVNDKMIKFKEDLASLRKFILNS